MPSLHDDWREIRAKLNKLMEEQLGKSVARSGLQTTGRCIRKLLVGLVR